MGRMTGRVAVGEEGPSRLKTTLVLHVPAIPELQRKGQWFMSSRTAWATDPDPAAATNNSQTLREPSLVPIDLNEAIPAAREGVHAKEVVSPQLSLGLPGPLFCSYDRDSLH